MIIILAFAIFRAGQREGFTAEQAKEVCDASQKVFDATGGNARYSDFKVKVPGADPVLYADTRELYLSKKLTPANLQKIM